MNTCSTATHTRAWRTRVRLGLTRDAGYSTETVIVTALLAVMGIAVIGIIVAKVTAKANGIDLGVGHEVAQFERIAQAGGLMRSGA